MIVSRCGSFQGMDSSQLSWDRLNYAKNSWKFLLTSTQHIRINIPIFMCLRVLERIPKRFANGTIATIIRYFLTNKPVELPALKFCIQCHPTLVFINSIYTQIFQESCGSILQKWPFHFHFLQEWPFSNFATSCSGLVLTKNTPCHID